MFLLQSDIRCFETVASLVLSRQPTGSQLGGIGKSHDVSSVPFSGPECCLPLPHATIDQWRNRWPATSASSVCSARTIDTNVAHAVSKPSSNCRLDLERHALTSDSRVATDCGCIVCCLSAASSCHTFPLVCVSFQSLPCTAERSEAGSDRY